MLTNIQIGDRVVTADLEWGTVTEFNPDGWHQITLDNGMRVSFDTSRLSRTHPFGDPDPRN